jgi:hypothetical protein
MDPKWRVRGAWALLILSIVGYPVCAMTIARNEPPVVLFLSFLAITITALDLLSTNQVHKKQADE